MTLSNKSKTAFIYWKGKVFLMYKEVKISSLHSDTLSKFRTSHNFENYGEIKNIDDYIFFNNWAKENRKKIYILGNGSNTFFTRKKITSLVLKNSISKEIKCISEEEKLFEITSNVMMNEVLHYCYKNSLDSFYYLASVPAATGGALAMNAGEGKHINKSIYDFVESVTFIDNDNIVKTIKPKDMNIEHRKTMFTGCQDKFIISAIFKFPQIDISRVNPIKERIQWAKEYQDNVAPNCGSVFKNSNSRIMAWLKGLKIGNAQYSSKTGNWIKNNSSNPISILVLINIGRFLHWIFRKKCEVEVVRVK
jgi:UDP-N-acetylmuramate dehydrogenase